MRTNKVERRKELQCAIFMKQKEIDDFRKQKTELEEEIGMKSDAAVNGDLSAIFPVLDFCGNRPRKDIRALPIEHFGSVMTQFDIATKEITKNNALLKQQLNELNRLIKTQAERFAKVKANTSSLTYSTGLVANGGTRTNGHKAIATNATEETPTVSLQELKLKKLVVERETKAGKLLIKKKEQAIIDVTKLVDNRKAVLDEIDAINNDILVADRDAKVEKEVLQGLITEHDSVDAKLNAAEEIKDSASRLLMVESISAIKNEISETVNVSRRAQERVIKAQDYRFDQLETRLADIQKALDNTHMTRVVNAFLLRGWASKNALLTVGDESDMYDLELIIPAQEKCHPAIYNLFLTEKERLARRISLFNIIAKEKEEVIDALACKVEALARECQRAIQELDQVASGAAYEEEEQRLKAMDYIREQRLYYSELFFERQKLKSQVMKTPRKITCK